MSWAFRRIQTFTFFHFECFELVWCFNRTSLFFQTPRRDTFEFILYLSCSGPDFTSSLPPLSEMNFLFQSPAPLRRYDSRTFMICDSSLCTVSDSCGQSQQFQESDSVSQILRHKDTLKLFFSYFFFLVCVADCCKKKKKGNGTLRIKQEVAALILSQHRYR